MSNWKPRVKLAQRKRPNGGQLCFGPLDIWCLTDVRINHATFGDSNWIVALITMRESEWEQAKDDENSSWFPLMTNRMASNDL